MSSLIFSKKLALIGLVILFLAPAFSHSVWWSILLPPEAAHQIGAILCGVSIFLVMLRRRHLLVDRTAFGFLLVFCVFVIYSFSSFFLVDSGEDAANKIIMLALGGLVGVLAASLNPLPEHKVQQLLFWLCVPGFLFLLSRSPLFGDLKFIGDTVSGEYQVAGRYAGYATVILLVRSLFCEKNLIGFSVFTLGIFAYLNMWFFASRQHVVSVSLVLMILTIKKVVECEKKWPSVLFVLAVTVVFAISIALYPTGETQIGDSRFLDRNMRAIDLIISLEIEELLAVSHRLALFSNAFEVWSKNMVFGAGFGSFLSVGGGDVYSHPHNMFLEVGAELGFIGLALFLVIVGYLASVLKLLTIGRLSFAMTAIAALVLTSFSTAMISGDLGTNRFLFILTAIFLGSIPKASSHPHLCDCAWEKK